MIKQVSILNTSISSNNLGDYIIMDSVKKELNDIMPDSFFVELQTHDKLGKVSYKNLKKSNLSIVGRTNLLSSNMNSYNQWKIGLIDSIFLKDVILMGVGWWQYQKDPNLYTKTLLRRVLSKKFFHAVRDNYTKRKLESIRISNVINTGCPTMWNLTPDHCKKIPKIKSNNVVCTFTDYNTCLEKDRKLIRVLKKCYDKIYVWIQGSQDYEYIKRISEKDVLVIPPNLEAFNQLLKSHISLDYVGTRLHAGIRAMQFFKRVIIIGIDNRSIEIGKDFNLKVIERDNIKQLENEINSNFETKLHLPLDDIEKWRNQFDG